MDYVPQIDFAAYGIDVDVDSVKTDVLTDLAQEVYNAFSTIGFVYLKNHGISEKKVRTHCAIAEI